MRIGETLAHARRRSGLTIAQVSQQTCIRKATIRGIEGDDYPACRGDFYARGHVRAIARDVGADPDPLIREYDAAPAMPPLASASDVSGWAERARPYPRRPLNWRVLLVLGLMFTAGLGVAADRVLPALYHPSRTTGGTALGTARRPHRAAPATAPASDPYARRVAIRLKATQDCWVQFTTPDGRYLFQSYVGAGTSKRWIFRRAIDMRLGNPAGIRLTVDGGHPLPPRTTGPVILHLGLNDRISG